MPKFELGRVVATPGALRAIRSSGHPGEGAGRMADRLLVDGRFFWHCE
jgi:hypothetical protein